METRRDRFAVQFGRRVRAERERLGLTQAQLAQQLQADGLTYMRPVTIAKIEAVDADARTQLRGVKLDEAAAFADVFGVTVDRLMGRRARPKADLFHGLRGVLDAGRQAAWSVSSAELVLRERAAELAGMDDADAYAELVADAEKAADALAEAGLVIAKVGDRPDKGI